MAKFLSGRQSNFNIGIKSYTESKTVLQTIGKVGIGTTNAGNYSLYVVGDANVSGIVSASAFYGNIFAGVATITSLTSTNLNVLGVSTLTTLSVGGTTGTSGQYLKSTGTGLVWSNFTSLRSVYSYISTEGQKQFVASGINTGYVDVFLNGIRLDDINYSIIGTGVSLGVGAFNQDEITIIGFNTVNAGSGGSGSSSQTLDQTLALGNSSALGMSVGVITATNFVGNGSGLTGIIAAGTGIVIKDDGVLVGTASTIDFGANLSVSPISAGVVTVTASGGSSGIATYATNAGIATYASSAGIATYATSAGIATYATSAGITTSGDYAQSGATSAYATKRVLQYNETTKAVTYSNTLDAVRAYITGYGPEIHVSPVAFDDTGNGTIGDPVKTIARAQVLATLAFETTGVGERKTIILHPGDYAENVTIDTQFTVLTTHELVGKNTTLSGTLTITKGCTINGLKMNNLVISATSATGSVDIIGCTVTTATTKTSSAYTVFRGCDLSSSSLSITGTGTVILVGGNYFTVTVNNAAAAVLSKAVVSMGPVTLTAGTLQLSDTLVYSATNTSNAITQSAGSVLTLNNSQTLIPTLTNVARNSFGGFYSILHSVYDKPNSTFGGTSLNSISYSQYINVDRIGIGTTNATSSLYVVGDEYVTGVVTATTFYGTFSGNAATATFATSSGIATFATNAGIATYATSAGIATYATNAGIATYATTAGIATYTSEWILGAVGSSDYTFTGPGFTGAENDPVLYLARGQQYKFTNTMGMHPFRIQSTVNGSTGTQYNDGIANNDVSNGTLTWNVQFDTPSLLYYQCTAHSGMGGKIYIIDAGIGTDVSINTTGIISATTFYGNLVGSITNATNLTGGYANASQLNVSGVATISQGRIQVDASSNLRFGNIAAGSGSGRNIAIGDQVLYSLSSGQGRNIGIGELSYYDTTSGQYNIGLGIQAGQKITTGNYNVILGGYDGQTGLDIRTSSNNVVIADGQGNIRQYINSSGNVGIKTTVITEALTVAGIVSATSFYGTLNAGQLTGSLPAINGSALIGVVGSGSGIIIQGNGTPVGTAGTINFASNLNVTFASGIATVSGTGLATYANVAGISTYATSSGVSTTSGTANYATSSGVSTTSVTAGYATTAGISSAVSASININTTGIITATSFSGSGSGLTNLPAAQLTGTLPAIDGSALLNVTAAGTGIAIRDDNSNIGSATTVNFGTGLDVTFSAGIATITASGGSLQSRTTVSGVTTSIANNGIGNTNITGFKSYGLMKVGLSTAGWLRLYTDSTSRTNDISRSVGEDPAPGSGVIAEVVTTGITTTQIISPFVMGGNLDNSPTTTIYAAIKNLSGSTQAITANLTILQLEA